MNSEMSGIKIALVVRHFSIEKGGLQRYSVNLGRSLMKKGLDVHILSNYVDPDLPFDIHWHPIQIIKNPSWMNVLTFTRNVRKVLGQESFDIVYALEQVTPADIYRMGNGVCTYWMRLRYPSKSLRVFNYLIRPVFFVTRIIENELFKGNDRLTIIANSNFSKKTAQDFFGIQDKHIKVIYNGVDHAVFNPDKSSVNRAMLRKGLGIPLEAPVILFVGNDWKRKGLKMILQAVQILDRTRYPFHIIVAGKGNPTPHIKHAQKNNFADRLHFVGPVKQVEHYYGTGDLLVLPTLFDPFANVCLEAMACGLPVVTSRFNGSHELIQTGQNGYILSDPRDPLELKNILETCSNITKLKEMGEAAHSTSLNFTIERNVQENLALFQQIIHSKRHPSEV